MASDAQTAANIENAKKSWTREVLRAKRKATEKEPLNPKSASFRAFIQGSAESPLAA